MKNVFIVLISLLMLLPAFESCKKGADDPALSLRSRKSRIVGEWVVALFESNSTTAYTSSGFISTTVSNETIDGKNFNGNSLETIIVSGSSSTENITTNGTASVAYTFNSDGTYAYSSSRNLTSTTIGDGFTSTSTISITEDMTGTWNFIGGAGDVKNKEAIGLTYLTSKTTTSITDNFSGSTQIYTATDNYTYGSNDIDETWFITKLANSSIDVILEWSTKSTTILSGDVTGTVTTDDAGEGTMSLEK